MHLPFAFSSITWSGPVFAFEEAKDVFLDTAATIKLVKRQISIQSSEFSIGPIVIRQTIDSAVHAGNGKLPSADMHLMTIGGSRQQCGGLKRTPKMTESCHIVS